MSYIVNPAWKSLKKDTEVVFKGEKYIIGDSAFGSLDAAVEAGKTSDLVIVDKNLSSPVKKENITGAATDIFTEIINDPEAVGTVTTNRSVKFTAAAGGTASIKDEDATLIGFDKVTANKAGGEFTGGKQDINSTVKIVEDSDREIKTEDKSSTISSTATGSLTVTGTSKDTLASVKVGPIAAESTDSQPVDVIAEAFEKVSGNSYEDDKTGASYANVKIKFAEIDSAINGGASTEKATIKTSDTAGSKINEEYTYSLNRKNGTGTADLTDTKAKAVYGFNTVKITVSAADSGFEFDKLSAESTVEDYALKTAYVEDVSATVTSTHKDNDSSSGTLVVNGKKDKEVAIGAIDGFSAMTLKYVTAAGEIDADTEIESKNIDIAVKAQKDNNAITYSYSFDKSETANGSLTAENSSLGNLDGIKTVTIKPSSSINGTADATDVKIKETVKLTGIAEVDISSNPSEYLEKNLDELFDEEESFTKDTYTKKENSVGGTSFKMSGKASAASKVTVKGYKTVDLDNTNTTDALTADIINDASTSETTEKTVLVKDSSYTKTENVTESNKAFGTASIKNNTTASASGVETVKVTGTNDTKLGEVFAQRTETYTRNSTTTIKAGKDNPTGNYTHSDSKSAKATASLEVKKAALTGKYYGSSYDSDKDDYIDGTFKSVKLTNVTKETDPLIFKNQTDKDRKYSQKIDWNADEISKDEAANVKTLAAAITDERITSWNETYEEKHTAVGAFTLKNDSASQIDALTVDEFQSIDITGTTADKLKLTGTKGTNAHTDKWSQTLSVTPVKGSYSYTDEKTQKAEASLKVTKATLSGESRKFKTVALTDVKTTGATINAYGTDVHAAAYGDGSSKYSQKFDWNAESATFADVAGTSGGAIYNESITSYSDSTDISVSAAGKFTLKGSNSSVAGMTVNYFQSADITGTSKVGDVALTGANGGNGWAEKTTQTLSVTTAKGTYSRSSEKSSKAEASLKVTKATLNGTFGSKPIDADFDYGFKTVELTDIATTSATFLGATTMTKKSNKKYDWNAEDATFKEVDETSGGAINNESITSYSKTHEIKTTASGKFSLKGSNSSVSGLTVSNFQNIDVTGKSTDVTAVTLNAATGSNSSITESYTETLAVTTAKGTYSKSSDDSTKAEASLKVTKASLNGTFSNFKSVDLNDIAVGTGDSATFTGIKDNSNKTSKKYEWKAEDATFADVKATSGGEIYNESITSYAYSSDTKNTAVATFKFKGTNAVDSLTIGNGFKTVDVTGDVKKVKLTGITGANSDTSKSSVTLAVTATKGTYSGSSESSTKAEATLKVTKANLDGAFNAFKTVTLTDVAVTSYPTSPDPDTAAASFTGIKDNSYKSSKKYEWKAEDATFADVAGTSGGAIYNESITSYSYSDESKQTAAGSFTFKGTANVVNALYVSDFQSVDVTGTAANVKLTGVAGAISHTDKGSETLAVTAKGTYSSSGEGTDKRDTTLKVTKATMSGSFTNLKSATLDEIATSGTAYFDGYGDDSNKSSTKYEWKAEDATFADVAGTSGGPIMNESITSYSDSTESTKAAGGTFTLKKTSETAALNLAGFKSVDITGTIDAKTFKTTVTGVTGAQTMKNKETNSLDVSKKGTYSYSKEYSGKSEATLKVTKAAIDSASVTNQKTVTLTDVKLNSASFSNARDEETSASTKFEWNAEDVTFASLNGKAADAFDENITSWNESNKTKYTVVGAMTLKNTAADATIDALSIDNFKTVEITLNATDAATANVAVASLAGASDKTNDYSLKRTVSETKRTQDVKEEAETTASSTLKVTGKSTTDKITTFTLADKAEVGYSTITLTDAQIAKADPGHTISASSYAVKSSYTASESATLETGSVVAVTLKVTTNSTKVGNGSFTASAKSYNKAYTAFDGTLNGYSTISLKDNVSIGNADNTKYYGYGADDYYVPWNGEYFDAIAAKAKGETSQGEKLTGNVSGSYSMDNKGQITSNWKAVYGTASTGSFTQTAKVKDVTAGAITGYDKVTLEGVKTVGAITGGNTDYTTVLTYKYAKDDVVANSKVVTTSSTVSSTLSVKGKEFDSKMQLTAVGNISGYKAVALTNADADDIYGGETETVVTEDLLKDTTITETTSTAIGILTAVDSQIAGTKAEVLGFKTVGLTNTDADAIDFTGGDSYSKADTKDTFAEQFKVSDSFSAVSNKAQDEDHYKTPDEKLNNLLAVGDILGYKKVTLTDYSAGNVATIGFTADASSSYEYTPADPDKEGSVNTWKTAAATKGTSFTAKTAKQHVVADAIVSNDMTVGDVLGFDSVDATGLASIGLIRNAYFQDNIDDTKFEGGRVYSDGHYGDWIATATESDDKYTTVDVKAGSGVKISGLTDKDSMSEKISKPTELTDDILGYQNVTLKDVTFEAGTAIDDTADYLFAGGKYSYSTRKSGDSKVSTSASTADGSLSISATAGEFTTYSASGFKSVNIRFDNVATFADFTAGEETAQFTDGAFNYNKFKVSGSLELAGAEGSELTGRVVGFAEATFTDVDMTAYAEIDGFEIAYDTKTSTYSYAAKSEVTFKDSNATVDSILGTITNAKEIKFTATADAGNDFVIDATIVSTAGNTTIEFDKCQATIADLSEFYLDAGDVIKLTSSVLEAPETTATIDLGDIADEAALNGMIANMSDVYISGSGDITFTTIGEQAFADTLAAAGITWDETVKFNGKHYDPPALA